MVKKEKEKIQTLTKAYDEKGNEITKAEMIKVIISQNKTMVSQATRGMK